MKEYEIERKKSSGAHIKLETWWQHQSHTKLQWSHFYCVLHGLFFLFLIYLFRSAYSNDGQGIFTNLYTVYVCFFYHTLKTSNHVSVKRLFFVFGFIFFGHGKMRPFNNQPTLIGNKKILFSTTHCNRCHAHNSNGDSNKKIAFVNNESIQWNYINRIKTLHAQHCRFANTFKSIILEMPLYDNRHFRNSEN